jgi:ABC-2 type transport system permease protein
MGAIFAIAIKDLKILVRDRMALFFTLVFPLAVAIFFGAIFRGGTGGGKVDLAIVNEDGGPASLAFVKDLGDDASLRLIADHHLEGEQGGDRVGPGRAEAPASRVPLSRERAMALVRHGDAHACVVIPNGFEEASGSMFAGGGLQLEGFVPPGQEATGAMLTGKLTEIGFRHVTRTFGDREAMSRQLEQSRQAVRTSEGVSLGDKLLFEAVFQSVDRLQQSLNAPEAEEDARAAGEGDAGQPAFAWQPVRVTMGEVVDERAKPRTSWDITFPQGVVWGLMGCVTAFAVSIAGEHQRGTMRRLTTAPISMAHILAGKGLACFVACLAVQALLLALAAGVFGVRIDKPHMMGVVVVLTSLAFVGVAMAMAAISTSELGAGGLARAVVLVLAMIGGGSIPVAFMPPLVQKLSGVSPFKWATIAVEGAMWRRLGWGELMTPAAVLLAFGVVGFLVGVAALCARARRSA